MNTRALATQLIQRVVVNQESLTDVMTSFKSQHPHQADLGFIQAVVFGVLRWYWRLAFLANELLEKPVKDKVLFHLLLVGVYQLSELNTPDYAAIQETVEAAKHLKKSWGANLVNAILRAFQRNRERLVIENDLEAYYAHPQWFIEKVQHAWPTEWKTLLENNNQHPPLTLRINRLKITPEAYYQKLLTESIAAKLTPPSGVIIEKPMNVTELPGFEEGLFSVQDAASQWVPTLLDLQPHQRVLDACAAPGGKTAHLLECEPSLQLTAMDISKSRVASIHQTLKRLSLSATVLQQDATQPDLWWDKTFFDRILLDAPCSASGVIRRHPDSKHLRKPDDFTSFPKRQYALLLALWPLLAPGGILVYTTCSIFPEENVEPIKKLLETYPDASLHPILLPVGKPLSIGHQILTGTDEMDGFYYACLTKKGL